MYCVQFCILTVFYQRMRRFVPHVGRHKPPPAEQAADSALATGASLQGSTRWQTCLPVPSGSSWLCSKDLGFPVCHLAISQLINSIKINNNFIPCLLVKTNTVFLQLFLQFILTFYTWVICCHGLLCHSVLPGCVKGGHASIYFNKKVFPGITLLKGWCKTKADPAHLNLPGNYISFCSPAKVASRAR